LNPHSDDIATKESNHHREKRMSAFLRTASRAVARPATATAAAARSFSSTASRPVARITIVGNLADSPELRASSTGREYLRYAVASNSGPADNRKTSWFNVSCFVEEGARRDFFLSLPKGCASLFLFRYLTG
jgi:tRNA uridine 5-carboxymethylaminomethyl modification enzyme